MSNLKTSLSSFDSYHGYLVGIRNLTFEQRLYYLLEQNTSFSNKNGEAEIDKPVKMYLLGPILLFPLP